MFLLVLLFHSGRLAARPRSFGGWPHPGHTTAFTLLTRIFQPVVPGNFHFFRGGRAVVRRKPERRPRGECSFTLQSAFPPSRAGGIGIYTSLETSCFQGSSPSPPDEGRRRDTYQGRGEEACFARDSPPPEPPPKPRSSGRENAPAESREMLEPTDVGCYGSGVQSANFRSAKSLPGPLPTRSSWREGSRVDTNGGRPAIRGRADASRRSGAGRGAEGSRRRPGGPRCGPETRRA